MSLRFIGVDPGLHGAIAHYQPATGMLQVWDMPTFEIIRNKKTKHELNDDELGNILAGLPEDVVAYVEKVGAMPGQGTSSMFSFGRSYGAVLGALAALQFKRCHVTPQEWKGYFKLGKDKDGSRRKASELFPTFSNLWPLVKHDGRAEAALIAYYGAKVHG